MNCLSGGRTLQKATNHFGRGDHDLQVVINGTVEIIDVPSNHCELMVSGPSGLPLGWANEAYFKEGENFKRRYTPEERRKSFDDEEVIFYEQTNSLCIQFDPTEGNQGCKDAFFALIKQAVESRI